jgi:hypothetical protein
MNFSPSFGDTGEKSGTAVALALAGLLVGVMADGFL